MDVRPSILITITNTFKSGNPKRFTAFSFILWQKDSSCHLAMTERQPAQDREMKSEKVANLIIFIIAVSF